MKTHLRSLALTFLCACTFLAGCGTSPEVQTRRTTQSAALVARTWYEAPTRYNNAGHSDDADSTLKFSEDGTGTLSSRRFGYTLPGGQLGSATGCGAYTEVITWPIAWSPDGENQFEVECTDGPTSTGPCFVAHQKALNLASVKLKGEALILQYENGQATTYHPVSPSDPRVNPSQSETQHRLAYWAAQGPQMLATTAAKKPSAEDLVRAVGDEGLLLSFKDNQRWQKEHGGTHTTTIVDTNGRGIRVRTGP